MFYRWMPWLLAAAFPWLPGCEEEDWWSVPEDLVTTDSVAIDGQVYLLSPHGDRVLRVDRETREVTSVTVGRNPRVLTADDGSAGEQYIYAINHDDYTVSVVDPEAFDADQDPGPAKTLQLRPFFDQLLFSPAGDVVVSYIGADISSADLAGLGSVNPNEIAVIDLQAGEDDAVFFRTLESRPTDVVFTADGSRALISTGTGLEVLPMDALDGGVTYPFTTDPAYPVGPTLVRVNPEGTLAFAAAPGSDVVYVLDLVDPNFNLIGTTFVPRDISLTASGDSTVVAGGTSQIVLFDNVTFVPEEIAVGTPVDTIVMNDSADTPIAILYNESTPQRSFAVVEFDDGVPEVETYATNDTITRIDLDPTGQTAVIFHDDDGFGNGRLSMFNLDARTPSTILLESAPHDLTFLATEDEAVEPIGYVMVVLLDAGRLVRYSLSTYEAAVIDVAERPDSVHELGDGFVYVVHDQPLGLLTFLNPYRPLALPGGYPTVYGYGLTGVLD